MLKNYEICCRNGFYLISSVIYRILSLFSVCAQQQLYGYKTLQAYSCCCAQTENRVSNYAQRDE